MTYMVLLESVKVEPAENLEIAEPDNGWNWEDIGPNPKNPVDEIMPDIRSRDLDPSATFRVRYGKISVLEFPEGSIHEIKQRIPDLNGGGYIEVGSTLESVDGYFLIEARTPGSGRLSVLRVVDNREEVSDRAYAAAKEVTGWLVGFIKSKNGSCSFVDLTPNDDKTSDT